MQAARCAPALCGGKPTDLAAGIASHQSNFLAARLNETENLLKQQAIRRMSAQGEERCPGSPIAVAAHCGWKPLANLLLSPHVIAANVSAVQARLMASASISRRPKFDPKELARYTCGTARKAGSSGFIFVQNAAPPSTGRPISGPTKSALHWGLSPILLFPPRRDRPGRNLGIHGSSSGTILCSSHKRHQFPAPVADPRPCGRIELSCGYRIS